MQSTITKELSLGTQGQWCQDISVHLGFSKPIVEAYSASSNRKSFCTPFMSDTTLASTPFVVGGNERFVNLSFAVKPRAYDEEKSIFFKLQNNKDPLTSSNYTIMYLYSWQDKKMIFNGFCVPPGESGKVLRYDNEDRSFCLEDTNVIVRHDGGMSKPPEELFKEMNEEADACTFSVMVTHAEALPPPPPQAKTRTRGMPVEVDGFPSIESDSVDSGMVTSRARMSKGGETNQRFRYLDLEYRDAPISIFHFTCMLASKNK